MNDSILNNKIATIILAGGEGSRLQPLTSVRCKPHVCFGGKYRLIDVPIAHALHAKIGQIFVLSQRFSEGLAQHLSSTYGQKRLEEGSLRLLSPKQTKDGTDWFLGTADAVRKTLEEIKNTSASYYLILSGDQLYHLDLLNMVRFAEEKGADLVISALPVKQQEAKRMGLLQVDADHKIIDFFEKPSDPSLLSRYRLPGEEEVYLGSMGIYVFRKEALIRLLEKTGNDFGKDLIPQKITEGNTFAFLHNGYWEDIGTISSYYEANLALTNKQNAFNMHALCSLTEGETLDSPRLGNSVVSDSIISPGCTIEESKITHSLIGLKTHIGKNSVIKDTIVIGNPGNDPLSSAFIGENCLIEKAIIDEGAFVGSNVTLVNKENLQQYDSNGLFIRDGIIVVPSGTKIPDGFTL